MIQFLFVILGAVAMLSGLFSCQPSKNIHKAQLSPAAGSAIIGGTISSPEDLVARSTVALMYYNDSTNKLDAFCTGTLISRNLILTASHCLRWMSVDELYVSFSISLNPDKDSLLNVKAAELITHPDYFDMKNDVALIKIAVNAPSTHQPVAILSERHNLQVGQTMILAGFGIIDDFNFTSSSVLRRVEVPLAKILDTILVTDQTKFSGACNGDSGGPAYLENAQQLFVYGITRGPHESATDCHHYGEYTYASKFQKFIVESAEQLGADQPQFSMPVADPVSKLQ